MANFRPFAVYVNPGADTRMNFEFTFRATVTNNEIVQGTITSPGTLVQLTSTQVTDTDVDEKFRQVRNMGPCPAIGDQGHGLYETPDHRIRPAYGRITEVFQYPIAIWVKPHSNFDAHMFYPVRKRDLFELQQSRDEQLRVGDFGYGLWLQEDGHVVFGIGRILQVFREAKIAFLDVPEEDEGDSVTGFVGEADPHPPILRFRSASTITAYQSRENE